MDLIKKRYPNNNYLLINKNIINLNYPDSHFDLIISNRVLQSIPKVEIYQIIKKISKISRFIYINEVSEVDSDIINPLNAHYIIQHNYKMMFDKNSFILSEYGSIKNENGKNQLWQLYKKV